MEPITVEYGGLNQQAFDERYHHKPHARFTPKSCLRKVREKCVCSGECIWQVLRKRVPMFDVFITYKFKEYILGDVLAGISLAIMHVPQGMGYALLSNLPPIIGLYTSFFPPLIYFIFGRSRHASVGTMALASLIIASTLNKVIPQFIADNNLDQAKNVTNGTDAGGGDLDDPINQEKIKIAMSISLMAGLVLIALSLMKLGILAAYISDPFMSGYLSGCNMQILIQQVKHMIGIKTGSYSGPLAIGYVLRDICLNIKYTNFADLITSIVAITLMVVVKKFINQRYASKMKAPVPIDMIVVVIATLISHFCNFEERFNVEIIKKIPQGLPQPSVPDPGYMGRFMMDAFILGFVDYVFLFIVVKMFSHKYDYPYDANQEMFATGIVGVVGSFFSCTTGSTSPARSILGDAAGGKTQLAQLISASLILLTLLFLAPLLQSLPICIIACLILVSCLPMFHYFNNIVLYWHTSKHDLAVWCVSFTATVLFGVDMGIIIGVGFSMIIVILRTQHPYSSIYGMATDSKVILDYNKYSHNIHLADHVRIFKFESPLYFATIDIFRNKLRRAVFTPDFGYLTEGDLDKAEPEPSSPAPTASPPESPLSLPLGSMTMLPGSPRSTRSGSTKKSMRRRQSTYVHPLETVIIECSLMTFIDTAGGKAIGELQKEYAEFGIKLVLAQVANEEAQHTLRVMLGNAIDIYPTIHDAIAGVEQAHLYIQGERMNLKHAYSHDMVHIGNTFI